MREFALAITFSREATTLAHALRYLPALRPSELLPCTSRAHASERLVHSCVHMSARAPAHGRETCVERFLRRFSAPALSIERRARVASVPFPRTPHPQAPSDTRVERRPPLSCAPPAGLNSLTRALHCFFAAIYMFFRSMFEIRRWISKQRSGENCFFTR